MTARRVCAIEARWFFEDESQQTHGLDPQDLDDDLIYFASGPVCGVFHPLPWDHLWMAHYGVRIEGWGHLLQPAREVLHAFEDACAPVGIIGWTEETNRAALAFAKRLGFVVEGVMDLPTGRVVMQRWVG